VHCAPLSIIARHSLLLPRHQVSVVMPGTAFKDVSLDVQGNQFLVRAPQYKLALQLQHLVDDKQASASACRCA
jgi:HSP20 family molecular chaperone IbpA